MSERNYQLSIINYQLSIINYQLSIISTDDVAREQIDDIMTNLARGARVIWAEMIPLEPEMKVDRAV